MDGDLVLQVRNLIGHSLKSQTIFNSHHFKINSRTIYYINVSEQTVERLCVTVAYSINSIRWLYCKTELRLSDLEGYKRHHMDTASVRSTHHHMALILCNHPCVHHAVVIRSEYVRFGIHHKGFWSHSHTMRGPVTVLLPAELWMNSFVVLREKGGDGSEPAQLTCPGATCPIHPLGCTSESSAVIVPPLTKHSQLVTDI